MRIFGYTPTIKSGVERYVTMNVATNMQRVVLHRTSVTAKPRAVQGRASAYISLIAYSTALLMQVLFTLYSSRFCFYLLMTSPKTMRCLSQQKKKESIKILIFNGLSNNILIQDLFNLIRRVLLLCFS